ncbi:S-layer homology domain-containing protein [Paenibacillus sp. FSL K6-0276]|uniref:S-layer homology domain-containing protein n=1 Tax=Paenibacillus sp. FSL K6-0276 TaxID=2921450 RepID=UPI0030ECC1F9
MTKEQLATFLVRILDKDADAKAKAKAALSVGDPTVTDWAKGYVELALKLKLLNNAPNGTFGGNVPADRELLVKGSFQSAKTLEESKPLFVTGGFFETGDKLNLKLTVQIDPKSIDLSKIKINDVPLDPKLDNFELSKDGKTIIIKLHKSLQFDDPSKMPKIDISGLTTLYGNSVKNDERNPIPVTATELLVTKPRSTTPSTTSEPATNQSPSPEPTPSPSPNPSQNPNPDD